MTAARPTSRSILAPMHEDRWQLAHFQSLERRLERVEGLLGDERVNVAKIAARVAGLVSALTLSLSVFVSVVF